MFQYQSGHRDRVGKGGAGGGGCTQLDADGFKLLPLFSIRHEAVTSLICAAALMFWVNELSAHRSASSSRLRCCYANRGAVQASSTFCRSPLGVQLLTASHGPGRPCMWSRLSPAALFEDAGADSPGCYPDTCPDLLTSDNMQIRRKCVGSTSTLETLNVSIQLWKDVINSTLSKGHQLPDCAAFHKRNTRTSWRQRWPTSWKMHFFLRLKLGKSD